MEYDLQRISRLSDSITKKKILFVSWYYEVLKTYLPYIQYFQKSYDIYILASCIPDGNDQHKCINFLKDNNIKGMTWKSDNPVDYAQIKGEDKNTFLYSSLKRVFFLLKEKKKASKIFNDIKPDIIFLVSDRREFEKYLIKRANSQSVPSINFQFSMGPISKKLLIDNRNENLPKDENPLRKIKGNLIKGIDALPAFILKRVLKLITPVYANCFGGGDATVLVVIGESSKDFYSSMGISSKKIKIAGHALYEEIYRNSIKNEIEMQQKKDTLYKSLDIPIDSQLICYFTSGRKHAYYKPGVRWNLSREADLIQRERKIKALLNLSPSLYIIIKIHPKDNIKEFSTLTKISPKVRVLQDLDSNQIIPFCSILLTRASTTALFGMLFGKPVITHNYPPIPMGSLFEELGGTIHVNNDEELTEVVSKILKKDESILRAIKNRRNEFMIKHLNIDPKHDHKNENKTLPSIIRMETLIETLII